MKLDTKYLIATQKENNDKININGNEFSFKTKKYKGNYEVCKGTILENGLSYRLSTKTRHININGAIIILNGKAFLEVKNKRVERFIYNTDELCICASDTIEHSDYLIDGGKRKLAFVNKNFSKLENDMELIANQIKKYGVGSYINEAIQTIYHIPEVLVVDRTKIKEEEKVKKHSL